MKRALLKLLLPVAIVATATGGYFFYRARVAVPPVRVVEGTTVGVRPAWAPVKTEFTLLNSSRWPVELSRLTNY